MKPPKLQHYEQLLWLALTEDMGPDRVDVTSAVTIPAHQQGAGEEQEAAERSVKFLKSLI